MKKAIFILSVLLFFGNWARAQALVPATSEDLSDFDQQVAAQSNKPSGNHSMNAAAKPSNVSNSNRSNFGALVSAEAHKLKAEGQQGTTKMGEWVSDQRNNNSQNGGVDTGHGRTDSNPGDSPSIPGGHGSSSSHGRHGN